MTDPLGTPGSGRQRYAAAMARHGTGQISDAVLEVYRIASARDDLNPADLLMEKGLPMPPHPTPTPKDMIRALVDAADSYLSTLTGPGVAEVRAGIAAARPGPVTPHTARPNRVLSDHLPTALATLTPTHSALSQAIADAAPHLDWHAFDGYPLDDIGAAFANGQVCASIIGEDAPIAAADFDLGLFLIAPHILYRDHHHAAPELYAPLTGPHGWRFGPASPLLIKQAHDPVWNDPHRPHLTKVGPIPFLCLFGWTRDVNENPQVIPATDWPALEAMRLAP